MSGRSSTTWIRSAARPAADASLPPALSFFGVSAPNAVISTVKKAEDGDAVVIRLYEFEGRTAEVGIESFRPIAGASRVNLIEDEGVSLSTAKGRVRFPLSAWAIETVKLRFR